MNQPPLFPWQRIWRAVAAVLITGTLAFYASLPRNSPVGLPGSTCLFREITGLPCALCGGTRATKALLHGDYDRALHLNAIAFPAVACFGALVLIWAWEALRGQALCNWSALAHRYRILLPITLVLLFIWWIVQIDAALTGRKKELIDLRNPIARALAVRFHHPSF